MAESWIRMRGSLVNNPKVIKMARVLLADAEFMEWFGCDGVTSASRCVTERHASVTRRHVSVVTRVTVGALVPLWSMVRECASSDETLRDITLFEVDEMAGVPGFGRAMVAVGWLLEQADGSLQFPNFGEHNTITESRSTEAKTPAERAREYRERKRKESDSEHHDSVTLDSSRGVTHASRDAVTQKRDASRDTVTTEKSREEKKNTSTSTAKLPTCPNDTIVSIYHEVLPELPSVRLMTVKRKRAMATLWSWVLTSKKSDGSRRAESADQAVEWLRNYFERARDNDFLMGRTPRNGEHANWQCDIDFLLSEKGMKQVIEKTREVATT
ncbi:hypothetical protein RD110_15725 [Rhodoferax koreense]|uniref:Uncharacterized protein n=1 Tax=Rhodoferax koreensis TaxID=1842727 RepID=A0A1P8JXI9_9BURK|nr:hypothetical protein [Rhodoferax koreense]APW38470.1 hypothetical protein RD110_15725 [Rhodoferax koreense]